ncbi:hypothetical protein D8S78_01535 [Natrialba swarupiae]|nr:hypothetical protein [Natrialba swarupiae]
MLTSRSRRARRDAPEETSSAERSSADSRAAEPRDGGDDEEPREDAGPVDPDGKASQAEPFRPAIHLE